MQSNLKVVVYYIADELTKSGAITSTFGNVS